MNTHVEQLAALIDDLFDLTRLQVQELEWSTEHSRSTSSSTTSVEAMRPAADAGSVAVRATLPRSLARRAATASSSGACSST